MVRPDGVKSRGIEFLTWEIEEVHPGSYDIKSRLKFMDGEGIWAQIIYPNLLGFGGQRAATLDPELRLIAPRSLTMRWPRFSRNRATASFRWR